MSTVVPFDTLALASALRDEAGLDQKQAEGFARVLSRALVGDLATKADLAEVRNELKADLAATEHRLDARITDLRSEVKLLEHRMTIKLGGLMVIAVGVLLAAIRYLPPAPH